MLKIKQTSTEVIKMLFYQILACTIHAKNEKVIYEE